MMLELTDEDFQRLLTLVSVGERVSNDWLPEHQWSEDQRRNADLLSELCSRAPSTRSEELVAQERTTGDWMPSAVLDGKTECMLRDYDEEVFWNQLVSRMADRDLIAEYGNAALDDLSPVHRQCAEDAMLSYYEHEVEAYGLARLNVDEKVQPSVRTKPRHNTAGSSTEKALRDFE